MGPAQATEFLTPATSAEVLALAVRAATHDGVRPLSEQTVLDIRRWPSTDPARLRTEHLVVLDDAEGPVKARAYAHLSLSSPAAAELVVDPDYRRMGLGSGLLTQLAQQHPDGRVWAHGDLPSARALATRLQLPKVRDLWRMARPLTGEWSDLPEVPLPEGFAVRGFQRGRDEDTWLAVNARAFATHPEQSRMMRADLEERLDEPWFDPSGFLLIEDLRGPQPVLAAFHWTKVEPDNPAHDHQRSGEVYVLGVDPAYQGHGLGKAITVLGLRHLRACGLASATLYVDGDNEAAIATYHRLGFERSSVDVMYSLTPP